MEFTALNLIEPILEALKEEKYTTPTAIQAEAIPIILQGRDLLGVAQTGTGKTAAFAIPILQLLKEGEVTTHKRRKVRALIITPTRELAIQIDESFKAYGRHTGLKSTVVFGGVSQNPQVNAIREGVDVLVATPGRLLDIINQGFLSLHNIEIFVLDEADRMLDMGFVHDVKKLLAILPVKKQTLFFSATMPGEIIKLANSILKNPSKVSVTPVSSTVDIITQQVYFVDRENKNSLLKVILQDENIKTALVFTRTKHGADKVVKFLINQTTRVLVATDIAARGIDVDDLQFVINFEMSNIPETYVHRIGRTGRAGAKGMAISFVDAEEKAFLKDVEKLIAKKIPVVEDHAFPLTDHNPVKAPQRQGRREIFNRNKTNVGGNTTKKRFN
jgi:ATP-dependent RNA helicase RhlE